MRQYEEPVEKVKDAGTAHERTVTTHPSFAMIRAGRVSGSANLFGSDIRHQHYMSIHIMPAEMHRNLSGDWYHDTGREIVEIAMSESQWQAFISSPNTVGTPCTLQHVQRESVPQLPPPKSRKKQFHTEALEAAQEAFDRLDLLLAEIDATQLSNSRKSSLRQRAESIRSSLTGSMPFILDQFSEHMEDTVNRAKAEINGYAAHVSSITGSQAPTLDAPQPHRIARSRKP